MKLGAKAYLRAAPRLEVAPFGGGTNEFISNQTLVRAEERLALTCPRPQAIVKITGLNMTAHLTGFKEAALGIHASEHHVLRGSFVVVILPV
jgi:hypothetical protein